jgi:phosphonate transport system ATP-binding protein
MNQPSNAARSHVQVDSLSVKRGDRQLFRALNLSVDRGGFLAIVGPSGGGKSSLLSCLAGLLPQTTGRILYQGKDGQCLGPSEIRGKLGFVFQHLRLTPNLSALTNTLCGTLGAKAWWQTMCGFDSASKDQAKDYLTTLGLGHCLHAPLSQMSGGERQRVALARALMQNPEVLLADEPVSHLDPTLARQVLGFLKARSRERGMTILCSLHDESLVETFADSVLELKAHHTHGWQLRSLSSGQ